MNAWVLLVASFVLFAIGYSQLEPRHASLVSIGAAFVLYVGIAFSFWRTGEYALCLVWFAYSLSQIGFAWLEVSK